MSALTNKNVLVIGEENSLLTNLKQTLEDHGMVIHNSTCDLVASETLEEKSIDIVLINYLSHGPACKNLLNTLRSVDTTKTLPIFALVEDNDDKIQEVFSYGVADYITNEEEVDSILQKIKTIFATETDVFGSTSIDITPIQPITSSTGIKVYIVEDDPMLRNLLSVRLDRSSFPYEFSNDGQNAVPAMRQFMPDVIILDLMLPGKSGLEVLAEVKADEKIKNIPVIVFSNRDGQEERKKAKELGAVGFYVKAMTDLSELIETIESLVK